MKPCAARRSLETTLLIHGDCSAKSQLACITRYGKEVWEAAARWQPDVVPLSDLPATWQANSTITSWQQVRGPVGAAILTLRRLGWQADLPFAWKDDRGLEVVVPRHTPAALQLLLLDAQQRWEQRRLAKRVGMQPANPRRAARACTEHLRSLIKDKQSPLNQAEKGALLGVCTGAIWPLERRRLARYATDGICKKCGMASDTILHRWSCPGRAADRIGIPQHVVDYALQEGNELLAERGLFAHPALYQPHPKQGMQLKTFGFEGLGKDAADITFDGPVAVDGSCFPHPCRDLWRAGWAVLQYDAEGNVVKGISGNVPAELPQTSVSGEYCAAAAYLEKAVQGTTAISDCANVVADWNGKSTRQRMAPTKVVGGIWKHCLAFSASPATHTIVKVKAHQSSQGGFSHLPPAERTAARANDHADHFAKDAAGDLHPPLQNKEDHKKTWDSAYGVAVALGKMAARWEQEPKLPRLPAEQSASAIGSVSSSSNAAASSASSLATPCQIFHQKVRDFNRGLLKPHSLMTTDTLIWCRCCGAFGEERAINLLRPAGCRGEPENSGQRSRLKLLLDNRHPKSGNRLKDCPWAW